MQEPTPLAERILAGDRRALAKAITLVENARPDRRRQAGALLSALLPHSGKSLRVGISGVPGVGKSTFIEALGLYLIAKGRRVAVLAVDPSSTLSGGSILGDKVRMAHLAREDNAFIRPSPSSGALGGVARRTRESMLLCEAAGYDAILVETVGVGQSEVAVSEMVDFFLVLMLPNAGDEIQGIKKGIIEMADMLVINKADGEMEKAAKRSRRHYRNALHLLRPKTAGWFPPVQCISALRQQGIDRVWADVLRHHDFTLGNGLFEGNRKQQQRQWFHAALRDGLMERLYQDGVTRGHMDALLADLDTNRRTAYQCAELLLERFFAARGGNASTGWESGPADESV